MLGKLPFLCVEQDRRGGGEVHATKELRELHLRVVELELLCVELHLWVVELELAEPELHLWVVELELKTRFCSSRRLEPSNLAIFVHLATLS